MGSQTVHGFPYPVGTDRVMDGDNAIQALAEEIDDQLYGGAGAPVNGPGLWQAVTGMVICTDASLTAQVGSSMSRTRFTKIGRTVIYEGVGTSGSAAAVAAVTLPNAVAGTPANRVYASGLFYGTGAAMPAQMGSAVFLSGLDRFVAINNSNGYVSFPAGTSLRWCITYETAN